MSTYQTDAPENADDRALRSAPGSGVWCVDASTGALHRLTHEGFDWVCVDMQHGRYGRGDLIDIARGWDHDAAQLAVRVPSAAFSSIGFVLDVGADIVVVPMVNSVADANACVEAAFYPPLGRRSAGQLQPTWGAPGRGVANANSGICCAVMIESTAGLNAVEEIAAVPGVGMLFVGPNDLALSLGTSVSGLLDDTSGASALGRIVEAARVNDVHIGAYAGDPETSRRFRQRGFQAIAVATDMWLLQQGALAALTATPPE
jgi:4-hydroxy-2-oxoheptanedioate aldolase